MHSLQTKTNLNLHKQPHKNYPDSGIKRLVSRWNLEILCIFNGEAVPPFIIINIIKIMKWNYG